MHLITILPLLLPLVSALPSRGPAPAHGRCTVWAKLTEHLPRGKTPNADVEIWIKDNNGVKLTSPTWWNGEVIGKRQRLLNQYTVLNDVIEKGSELSIGWKGVKG